MKIYAVPEDVLLELISFEADIPCCDECPDKAEGCDGSEPDRSCEWRKVRLCPSCGSGASLNPDDHPGCVFQQRLRDLLEV